MAKGSWPGAEPALNVSQATLRTSFMTTLNQNSLDFVQCNVIGCSDNDAAGG